MTPLYDVAAQWLVTLSGILESHGITYSPNLQLRTGNGLLCYYNRADGNLYLCLPDQPLTAAMLMATMNCASQEELATVFELLMPWLVSHEIGHHLRHYAGLETQNWWYEEQVANLFALSVTSFSEVPHLISFVEDAITVIKRYIPDPELVIRGFSVKPRFDLANSVYLRDVVEPLNASYSQVPLRVLYCLLIWLRCQLDYVEPVSLEQVLQNYFSVVNVSENTNSPLPNTLDRSQAIIQGLGTW